ncbi:MAG: class II glutamine amidotransferase, partial [bacterium]
MCGIIGYKGKRNANEVVLNGLKKLEYRGYDSWGIASKKDSKIEIAKKVGKIGGVSLNELKLKPSNVAIAHTRWSTHGAVTERNAHPQMSNNKKIAVVHNGIIENYQKLKKYLIEKGFEFKSETDTEIISNLIEYFTRKYEFEESVKKTLRMLEGS